MFGSFMWLALIPICKWEYPEIIWFLKWHQRSIWLFYQSSLSSSTFCHTFQVYLLLFRNIINEREDERLVLCPFMDWSLFHLSCSPFDMNNIIIILASQHTAVKCQQGCKLSPRRTRTHNTPSLLVPDVDVCLQLPYKTLKEGKQVATGQ